MCLQFLRLLASSSGLLACTLPTLDSANSVDSEIHQNTWRQKQDQQYTILLISSISVHCSLKKNSLMESVGEGEGGKIWENGIETCKYHV